MAPVLCKANLNNTARRGQYVAHRTWGQCVSCGTSTEFLNQALECKRCSTLSDKTYGVHAHVYHVDLIPLRVQLMVMWQLPMYLKVRVVSMVMRRKEPNMLVAGAVADPEVVGYAKFYRLILDYSQTQIAQALRVVATSVREGQTPILVHCIHGKDRTGLIVALLLKLCGVSDEAIVRDYVISELNLRHGRESNQLDSLGVPLTTDQVIAASAEVMVSSLEHIRRHWGSIVRYVHHKLELSSDEINDIRSGIMQPEAFARVDASDVTTDVVASPVRDLSSRQMKPTSDQQSVDFNRVSVAVARVTERYERKRANKEAGDDFLGRLHLLSPNAKSAPT